jgi:hypothetical protein
MLPRKAADYALGSIRPTGRKNDGMIEGRVLRATGYCGGKASHQRREQCLVQKLIAQTVVEAS